MTLILAALLLLAPQAPAGSIAVPAGQHVVLSALGRGFQIYRCQADASAAPHWVFLAPRAELFRDERKIGTHDAGPTWHHVDGSSVAGSVLGSVPSDNLGSIPQLLLQAKAPAGAGVLSQVTWIRRTATQGGVAPRTDCDADHLQQVTEVPYQATYTFYAPD